MRIKTLSLASIIGLTLGLSEAHLFPRRSLLQSPPVLMKPARGRWKRKLCDGPRHLSADEVSQLEAMHSRYDRKRLLSFLLRKRGLLGPVVTRVKKRKERQPKRRVKKLPRALKSYLALIKAARC